MHISCQENPDAKNFIIQLKQKDFNATLSKAPAQGIFVIEKFLPTFLDEGRQILPTDPEINETHFYQKLSFILRTFYLIPSYSLHIFKKGLKNVVF